MLSWQQSKETFLQTPDYIANLALIDYCCATQRNDHSGISYLPECIPRHMSQQACLVSEHRCVIYYSIEGVGRQSFQSADIALHLPVVPLITICVLQYLVGLYVYLFPKLAIRSRRAMAPIHQFFGRATFTAGLATMAVSTAPAFSSRVLVCKSRASVHMWYSDALWHCAT